MKADNETLTIQEKNRGLRLDNLSKDNGGFQETKKKFFLHGEAEESKVNGRLTKLRGTIGGCRQGSVWP